jgi:RimJ/RimL family protein N-acetyltransferase
MSFVLNHIEKAVKIRALDNAAPKAPAATLISRQTSIRSTELEIRLARPADLPLFFGYLNSQLLENGLDGTPVFQPMSREESQLNNAMKARFKEGIVKTQGEPGWRTMLLALKDDRIVGHIDIRPHPENHTSHRALLGMGVDQAYRGQGLGRQLLEALFQWAAANTELEHIDLWLLTDNQPAYRLYQHNGFVKCGEIPDMFRIDGRSLSYTMMSRPIVR